MPKLPKNFFLIPLVIAIILLVVLMVVFSRGTCASNSVNVLEGFTDDENTVSKVERPFVNFYDNYGNRLNIIAISKPYSNDDNQKKYEELVKEGNIIIGVSSYLEFPNPVSSPFENFDDNYAKYKYKERCKAWLHGFTIVEVPVIFTDRTEGESKMNSDIFFEAFVGVIQLKVKSWFTKFEQAKK